MNRATVKNIIVFTWHSEKNIALLRQFLRFLQDEMKANVFIVTTDATGKLRLLENQYDSFTVNEILINFAPDKTNSGSALPQTQGNPIDLHLNWLYTPKDPVSLAHPARTPTRRYYDWKRQQLIAGYSGFLREFSADSVITWNGSLLVTGALAESADLLGIPTFYMERGLLPGSLVIDPKGVNSDSSIAGADWQKNATAKPDQAEILLPTWQLGRFHREDRPEKRQRSCPGAARSFP